MWHIAQQCVVCRIGSSALFGKAAMHAAKGTKICTDAVAGLNRHWHAAGASCGSVALGNDPKVVCYSAVN